MERLGHINRGYGRQCEQFRDERLRDTGLCGGLRAIICTAEGSRPRLTDCYPLRHTEHASESSDIPLSHNNQTGPRAHVSIFTFSTATLPFFIHILPLTVPCF